DAIQPSVFLGRCFETRRDAEIVFRRVHIFTAREPFHYFFRSMAHTLVCHPDKRAIIGLHDEPHIDRRRSIAAERLPVAAAGNDLASQTLALEAAASNLTDAPIIAGSCADQIWRIHVNPEDEQGPVAQLRNLTRKYCCQGFFLHGVLDSGFANLLLSM